MKANQILCPIDYSVYSKAANFYASLFAEATDAQIIYLSVNWPARNDFPVEDQLEERLEKLSAEIRPYIHGVRHRFEVRDGNPGKEILKLAKEENVDLIVIGTHGHSGVSRLLHGSVCSYVLRHSECPVMAVKSAMNMNWIVSDDERKAFDAGWKIASGKIQGDKT